MSSETATRSGTGPITGLVEEHFDSANRLQLGALALMVVGLVAAPAWADSTTLRVLALGSIWAILAMGWDIISGYTGYISFGHSALSGAAAYTTALLLANVDPNIPLFVTFPLSVLAALIVGLLFALPSLRLKGPYFSLMTLLAVLIFSRLVFPFKEYTGGELGVSVPTISYDPVVRYYVVLFPMLLIAVGLLYVSRSNVGTVFVAIRANEPAVEAAGIDTTKFKLWAFTLSAIPMGIGGTLLAHFFGNVDPNTVLVIDRSIEMIVIAAIGGMGSILGPLVAAYLFVFLRDEFLLHTIGLGTTQRWIALWLIAGALLVFARHGVFRYLWHGLGQYDSLRGLGRGVAGWLGHLPRRTYDGARVLAREGADWMRNLPELARTQRGGGRR